MRRSISRGILLLASLAASAVNGQGLLPEARPERERDPTMLRVRGQAPTTSVIARFAEFDDEFRAMLSRPEMLDRAGNVAKNLPDQDLTQLQDIFRKTLRIEVTTSEARKFAIEQVQVARMGGRGWQQKLSIAQFHREGPSTHGFFAEAVNFDQFVREHPNSVPQYARPGSQSVDLVLFRRDAPGVLVGGVQTKAWRDATDSLREGLDDAQTFFANKSPKASFELYIPKDQFDELTSRGSIDPKTFRLTRPDEYLDRLSKNVKIAFESDGAESLGSKASRLREIVDHHGNPLEFNRRVLAQAQIRPLDRDYEGVKKLQMECAEAKRSLVDRSAYRHFVDNMPSDFKVATNAAAVAAAFSAMNTLWTEGASVESAQEASKQATEVAAKTFGSTYVAHGVMRRVGARLVFSTFIDAGVLDGEQRSQLAMSLPKKGQTLFAAHYAGTAFIATFIFDQSGTVLGLARGEVDDADFLFETGQNLLTAGASSVATWATVALGFTPGGCVVAAAAIGTHVLIGTAKNLVELYDARRHLSLADFIGRLPPEIANRCTAFDPQRAALEFEGRLDRDSVFDPQRPSVFENRVQERSVFEP